MLIDNLVGRFGHNPNSALLQATLDRGQAAGAGLDRLQGGDNRGVLLGGAFRGFLLGSLCFLGGFAFGLGLLLDLGVKPLQGFGVDSAGGRVDVG